MQSILSSLREDVYNYDLHGYQPIKDYAIIGDLHTVALVSKKGSIDWYCLPNIDSPSVFGRLLDYSKGGFFQIQSTDEKAEYEQIYYPETNILLTRIATSEGMAELTDFMPVRESKTSEPEHILIRSVLGTIGKLQITVTCRPAFNYAREASCAEIIEDGSGALFHSSTLTLALTASSPVKFSKDSHDGVSATFTLAQGEQKIFYLSSIARTADHSPKIDKHKYNRLFNETFHYWHDWMNQCTYQGRWREMVQRSALVLKLLTYAPTGAVVAAATTSLPETLGGARNWDYRYTWLRDAAFTLDSLLRLGFTQEAEAFMDWLDKRCDKRDEAGKIKIQPVYSIFGETDLQEQTLSHLEGYKCSNPVRIGNKASKQQQLDIYGELLDAIFVYSDRYRAISYDLWVHIQEFLESLKERWKEPDEGIWEVRGGKQKFLHSRLMSWVAFDRAIRIAQKWGWAAPLADWESMRSKIYDEIMKNALHKQNKHESYFTQCYGSEVVDASTLLLLLTNFVGPNEPRMRTTLHQIQKELEFGPSILRYKPEAAADDGFKDSKEGAFSACSFWFVECQARMGLVDDARLRLEKLLSLANHVGLYAEEIDERGKPLGNFPQAFTHLTLISACLAVNQAINDSLTLKH